MSPPPVACPEAPVTVPVEIPDYLPPDIAPEAAPPGTLRQRWIHALRTRGNEQICGQWRVDSLSSKVFGAKPGFCALGLLFDIAGLWQLPTHEWNPMAGRVLNDAGLTSDGMWAIVAANDGLHDRAGLSFAQIADRLEAGTL